MAEQKKKVKLGIELVKLGEPIGSKPKRGRPKKDEGSKDAG